MLNDEEYFHHLYEIARNLNKVYSLNAALRISLEKTVEILNVETGWIWLTEPDGKSVYLAASHNLPPALSNHPERLSGWCYCIKQYFEDDINQAMNISEISCSRLKDLSSGTKGLKYHATIPITINRQKVGILNLLSRENHRLGQKELAILNTISELVGTAIQRTRLQQSINKTGPVADASLHKVLNRLVCPELEAVVKDLEGPSSEKNNGARLRAKELLQQLHSLLKEPAVQQNMDNEGKDFHYPETPLTRRELEVLSLVKEGNTNSQIGTKLFISERTVKFHITTILSKLHAKNRTEAVDLSLKRGLL